MAPVKSQSVNMARNDFVVTGQQNDLVFFDNDGVLGSNDSDDTVSVNGGPPQSFTFLGTGVTRSGQSVAFVDVGGEVYAFESSFSGDRVQTGNTKLSQPELDGETPVQLPCFLPGTLIETPEGERPVEDLAAGDLVTTLDNGDLAIRWVGRRKLAPDFLTAHPNFCPIRIRAHAFGRGAPKRDLWISPQHRVLISGPETELHFGAREMLAPARGLVDGMRIVTETEPRAVEYIHLLFDSHQIIRSNGLWTESFHPGPRNLSAYSMAARAELMALFPGLERDPHGVYGAAARPSLEVWEAEALSRL